MAAPFQVEAAVTSDGQIHLSVPGLTTGQRVRVTIEPVEPTNASERRPAIDILRDSPGHRLFKTADEADAYLKKERDSWDR